MEVAMKVTTDLSIGAALQACVSKAPVRGEPQPRPAAPAMRSRDHQEAPDRHLTPRQLEVLALLCEGLPNKLICRRLNIATGTVKVHISGILRELAAASRLEAVVKARRLGLGSEEAARNQAARVPANPPPAARAGGYHPGHGVFADA
jgi:DNA-binding NarL/FixJ family response regulator